MKHNRYSDMKIAHFPEKLQALLAGRITAPIYVRVKPINLCDHACFFCAYSTGFRKGDRANHIQSGMHKEMHEQDVMPAEKMHEILDDFHDMGVKAVTYSGGGEPLMHTHIVAFMEKTLEHGIDLSIITNGQMLVKRRAEVLAHAKWVRVSIDYTSAAEMAASRAVPEKNFAMVLTNLKKFASMKDEGCDLGVNFIVHQNNYHRIAEFAGTLKDLGVENVRFSPMWVPQIASYHAPILKEVQRQMERARALIDERFSINSTYDVESESHSPMRAYTHCHYMQVVPVIGADQVVYACHNTAYAKHGAIGSIKHQSFKDLWFSDEAKTVFEGLNPQHVCKHQCASDFKNRFINQLAEAGADNFV
jgi:MoaA/NifB/PqqE/SkfB family radical SAM enzyme